MTGWHDEARRLRAEGGTVRQIARSLGKHHSWVARVCKSVDCPIDHNRQRWISYWKARGGLPDDFPDATKRTRQPEVMA